MNDHLHSDVITHLASRSMRTTHYIWHTARDIWLRATPEQQQAFEAKFQWTPRPSLDVSGRPIEDPAWGLDFLHMHRTMIEHVNAMQAERGLGPIIAWGAPPPVGNTDFPVDRNWLLEPRTFTDDVKWAELLAQWPPGRAASFDSLAKLGAAIEYTIHAAMHQRFGGLSKDGRRRIDHSLSIDWPLPSEEWDNPEYDSLLDMYSAHVNPIFWSIHGWIDNMITEWEAAHGKKADWTGTNLAPMPHEHDEHGGHGGHTHPSPLPPPSPVAPDGHDHSGHTPTLHVSPGLRITGTTGVIPATSPP